MTNLAEVDQIEDQAFQLRFDNWVQWCKRKGVHYAKAGSAEGNYRSPQIWEPPNPRPPLLDEHDALKVNRAYIALGDRTRRIIKMLVFHDHLRPTWQGQKLGIHHTQLPEALRQAKLMLKNRLAHNRE